MKRLLNDIKTKLARFPVPFWVSFYIFLVVITLPVLAYIGNFGRAAPPTVVTSQATEVTANSVVLHGKAEGAPITQRGIELGTSSGSYTQTLQDTSNVGQYSFYQKWGTGGSGNGQFNAPREVAIDSQGNFYVTDSSNHRIQKFDSNGTYITKWGTNGSGNSQFNNPNGIAIDSSDNIYVSDRNNHRIQKFDSNGTYITKWGTNGSGNGQFNDAINVAVDGSNNVYVVSNGRLQKFDSNGSFITRWDSQGSGAGQFNAGLDIVIDSDGNIYNSDFSNHRIQKLDSAGNFVTEWGTNGSGNGQFNFPSGLGIDTDNNIYVSDTINFRIQKFSNSGTFLAAFGSGGSQNGQLAAPNGVTVADDDTVYVADTSNQRIQRFGPPGSIYVSVPDLECETTYYYRAYATNPDGTSYGQEETFTTSACPVVPDVSTGSASSITETSATLNGTASPKGVTERGFQYGTTTSYGQTIQDQGAFSYVFASKWGSSGTGNGQFGLAYGITIDSNDNVYVSDISNNNIQKFDRAGNFITKWGSSGGGDGQFNSPYGIDVDSQNNVYVVDYNNNRIQKFDSNGTYITKWGSSGGGDGQFNYIQGLAVGGDGSVYVADSGNNRIQKFDSNGTYITKWGSSGGGDGQFNNPVTATVDSAGNVYVADFNNNRIQKFDSNGTYITKWGSSVGVGQLSGPYDLDVDSNDNILVIEGGGDQVQKFDSNGTYITKWGSSGSGDGQFNVGVGIAVNSIDEVYTTDFLVDRIQKFSGSVTASVSSLVCGTTYHYRAYATNSDGTGYGTDQTFTTADCPPEPFIFRVKTDNTGTIVTGDTQFLIPANTDVYAYNYNVDCNNDGTTEYVNQTGDVICNYGVPGEYDVAISGVYPHMDNSLRDVDKIIDIKQWGDIEWQTMRYMFWKATYMQMSATDAPNLTSVFDMERMFYETYFFNSNIESWDVSNVTNMSGLFADTTSFNQPLNNWNTSNVTDMAFMFDGATSFNQPLNNWDTSSVVNMSSMFQETPLFNQPLNAWNTSNVTDMSGMFFLATGFNNSINDWNTSNVTSINQMFLGATSFNQPLNSWDTSSVVFFQGVFFGATSFNQPLNNWNVSAGDSLQMVFAGASSFNQDMSSWNTSNVTNMSGTFAGATSFNQSLASWDVSNVTDMSNMFGDGMGFFPDSSGLSVANYDATLIAWSQRTLQPSVVFDAGTSIYCDSEVQRQSLIDNSLWTINDAGKDCTTASLGVPQNLSGDPGVASVDLNWDDVVGADYYNVEYKKSADSGWTQYSGSTINNSYVLVNGLDSETEYEFRVRSANWTSGQQSDWSDIFTTTTLVPQTYYISDCAELQGIAVNPYTFEIGDVTGNYILENDIDCSESANWYWEGLVPPELPGPLGFVAITDLFNDLPFTGTFDGQGFTISNIYQDSRYIAQSGLFGRVSGSEINDVTIDSSTIKGNETGSGEINAAGLIGYGLNATVNNVTVSNVDIQGQPVQVVGGLAAVLEQSTIVGSTVSGQISLAPSATVEVTDYGSVGGMVGLLLGDNVSQSGLSKSYSTVDINIVHDGEKAGITVGGLVGASSSAVDNSYAWGSVLVDASDEDADLFYIGGLSGQQLGSVSNSYANTDISASANEASNTAIIAGGLLGAIVGDIDGNPVNNSIENSFGMGLVDMPALNNMSRGGLVGAVMAAPGNTPSTSIQNSFYDQTITAQSNCVGGYLDGEFGTVPQPPLIECNAVNTDGNNSTYFINNSSNQPLDEWDFDSIWQANVLTPPVFLGDSLPEPTLPGAPRNLSTSNATASFIDLNWLAPSSTGNSPITDYIIQYKLSSSGTWQTFNDGTSTNLNASVSGLNQASSYDFRVAAVNAIGQGPFTEPVSGSTLGPPSAPQNFAGEVVGATSVDLGWEAPISDGGSSVTDYIIQYKLSSSGTWQTFNDGTSTNLSTVVSGLTTNQLYDFRVAAVNAIGQGPYATINDILAESLLPGPPRNLTAVNSDGVSAGLQWQEPLSGDPFTDYIIQYKLSSSGTWQTFNDGTSTNLSSTVNSLTNGQTYDFRVAATNEYGQGEWSNVATLQMLIMLSDCEELQLELSSNLGSHYGLANDIDCSDTINWNGGEGWDPVGVNGAEQPFTGTLEGYGNSITGLYINNSAESSVGMFSVLSGATIKNLVLTGGSTTASLDSPSSFGSTVGAIAGGIYESATIQNVIADSSVLNSGSGYIGSASGGLIGYILYDTNVSQAIAISGSSSTGNVSGGSVVGGLVGSAVVDGLNNNSPVEDIPIDTLISITASYSTGNVTGTTASAGIIGATYGASINIQDSHATGTILTENPNGGVGYAGGIIALAPPVTARVEMDGVYATGDVLLGDGFQTAQAGGLAGTIVAGTKFYDGVPSETLGNFGLIIRDSYATGSIYNETGSTNSIGGLVSVSQVTQIENSYYNGSLSGQTVGGTGNGNIVVGGLIAQSGITRVSDSYANVDIVSTIDVPRKLSVEGGLVGFSLWADVRRSYANGSIQSFQLSQCEDEDCYNSASHVGGLIGAISGAASLSDPASEDSVVEDSNASVAISIDGSRSQSEGGNGGLIGSLSSMNDSNTRILGSSATGNVITDTSGPQSSSGGLVGTILSRNQPRVQISRSHATGNVVMSTVAEQNSLKPVVPFFITASGGLIGLFWGEGSVDQSYATGNSTGPRAGGLIGYAYAAGPILDSDDVSADDNIDLAITNSYATGNAQSQQQVYDIDGTDVFYSDSSGGLVGVFVGSRIENSYASGSVQANTQNSPGFTGIPTIDVLYQYGHAGGLVGILSGAVSGSFANGSVSSPSPSTRGGLVGVLSLYSDNINVVTSLQNSYFDKTRSGGQACANSFNIVGDPSNPESVNLNPYALGCIGVNENSSQPTYFFNTICNPPLNSWDFNTVWRVQKNSGPRFVSDPSASPSGCGSAPSTPTTPTTPINPTSPTNPPSSTDDDQGSIPPNTGGGAGSGRQRPSSGSRALAPVSQPILGAVIGPIIRFAETIPSPIARAIPWTILLLLIAIASFYGYSSYQEQQRRKKLIMITNRFKASLAARATYLQITSHYIKTPITKMQGVIELLASGVISAGSSSSSGTQANLSVSATTLTIPESTIVAAKSGIESLSKHADELLTEGYSLTGQQQAYIREFGKHRILGVLSHPAFWLPAVVVLTLAILANVLFIHVDKYDATFINLTSQILLALVGILALGVSYYFLRQSKEQQNMAQIQLKIEEDISNRQQQLIAATSAKLSDDVELLSSLQNDIVKYPKTASYGAGLSELRKVVNQFTKLEQLSHSVPGLTWKTDVNAVLQRAISDTRELADERGVSVSVDVENSVLVNVEEQAFTHLVSAPLKNAIQASSAGAQVSITSQLERKTNTFRVIISDHGSGIASDKLKTIFEPFNSATSTERFNNTGLGLDLYLAKTISAQYGADISLSSNAQSGTTATITVMIADE